MLVTQKKQYAVRAIFELAKRSGKGPVKTSEIAESQAIPLRFLEVILSQLKRKGIVASKRGFYGGYTLLIQPNRLTVGDIFRLLDDEDPSTDCISCQTKKNCSLYGNCVFMEMWDKVYKTMYEIYDGTSMQQLIEDEKTDEPE